MSAQPERQAILDGMVLAMQQLREPSFAELAEAALSALEAPRRAKETVTPCTCGHSGYAKDGPHQPSCPLAR